MARGFSDRVGPWRPDEQMVDCALHGTLPITQLSAPDRAHVVLELSRRGHTIEQVAECLGCSDRLINQVLASDVTTAVAYGLSQRDAAGAPGVALRVQGIELERARARARELKAQRDRLIEDRRMRL